MLKPIILTNDQKKLILERWNNKELDPPSQRELLDLCFPKLNLTVRTLEWRAIKEYCASLSIKPVVSEKHVLKPKVILTEEQKEYITNNASSMTSFEFAKEMFNDRRVTPLSMETRAVQEHLKTLDPNLLYKKSEGEEVPDEEYRPPLTPVRAAARLNKYSINCITPEQLTKDTRIQNNLKSLIKFCQMFRFQRIMSSFKMIKDRNLFESSYIRFVWDKPDLTEEELDLICNLSLNIVNYTNMQQEINDLREMRDKCLDDSEGKRLSMSIVEEMKNIKKDLDENEKRQNSIIKTIQGTRDSRIDIKAKENASVVQLVDAWREEQERQRIIKLGNDNKEKIKNELIKLDTLEEFIGQIWGINKDSF